MALTNDQVVEWLSNLAPADLDALLKGIEDKWGVSVTAAAVGGAATTNTSDAKPDDVQTEFTVVLKAGGASKINVIKVVRELTGLGLKDAKDLVDGAPKEVKAGVSKTEADDMAKKLKDAGAEVELK